MRIAKRGKVLRLTDRSLGSWLIFGASAVLTLLVGWLTFLAGPLTFDLQILAFTCFVVVLAMITAELTQLPRMITVIDRGAGTIRIVCRDGGRYTEDRLALSDVTGIGVFPKSYADGRSLWQLALVSRDGTPVPVSLPTRSSAASLEPVTRALRSEMGLAST